MFLCTSPSFFVLVAQLLIEFRVLESGLCHAEGYRLEPRYRPVLSISTAY